jgi:phospholipid/cholesterol/gamma-HCH transport system substrate-binding protein
VPGGVEIDMDIDSGTAIPVGSRANARSLSAVGEQYIDIVPDRSDGPYLEDGGTIPKEHTTVPEEIGPVLDQVNKLVAALPADDLNTVVNEAYDAVRGAGDDLQRTFDGGRNLLTKADQNYEPTAKLLDDLGPLLDSQTEIDPQLRSLTSDLASVTDQRRASDPDIRGLLKDGQPFAQQVGGLLNDVRPTLPVLLGNLVTVGDVLLTYNANVQQILVVYPALVASAQAAVAPQGADHQVAVDLTAALNDPPPCTTGFVPADQWRNPADTSVVPPPDAYCKLPSNDPSAVRGARNTPCAEFPDRRAASPAACRGERSPVEAPDNPAFPPDSAIGALVAAGRPVAGITAVPYDPLSGRAVGPDGKPFFLRGVGTTTTESSEEKTWQSLLTQPVGL